MQTLTKIGLGLLVLGTAGVARADRKGPHFDDISGSELGLWSCENVYTDGHKTTSTLEVTPHGQGALHYEFREVTPSGASRVTQYSIDLIDLEKHWQAVSEAGEANMHAIQRLAITEVGARIHLAAESWDDADKKYHRFWDMTCAK